MPRQRVLKPEIWTDEGFIELSPQAKLLFIGLISHADDEGRGISNVSAIRAKVFPADHDLSNKDIVSYKHEVAEKLRVRFYQINGREYYQLDRWADHQSISHPKPSNIPPPEKGIPEDSTIIPEESRNDHGTIPERSDNVPPNELINKVTNKLNKYPYAEHVRMTKDEHQKLVEAYGEDATRQLIERLDNWKGSKGKTYKNDYRAILSWVVDAVGVQPRASPAKAKKICPSCGKEYVGSFCKCGWSKNEPIQPGT